MLRLAHVLCKNNETTLLLINNEESKIQKCPSRLSLMNRSTKKNIAVTFTIFEQSIKSYLRIKYNNTDLI